MIIRTYSDEENAIVKVWTPERISEVKKVRPVGGFHTKTLEVDEATIEDFKMDSEQLEYDAVMYVDNAMSVCRNTSGWDQIPCQEHVKDRVLYRCLFCHYRNQEEYCKGTTSTGRRCSQEVRDKIEGPGSRLSDVEDYCRWHTEQREHYGFKFELSKLDRWLEGHQLETVTLWKRQLIRKLQVLEEVTYDQIVAVKNILEDIKAGNVRPRHLPTKTNTYFVWCDGYVKIGQSKDPEKRFSDLCRENDTTIRPDGVDMTNAKLLGWVAGDVAIEKYLHGLFTGASKWVTGEWFHYDTEAAILIDMILGDKEFSIGYVLDDIIKNYDVIVGHDVQGGLPFKADKKYIDELRETFQLSAVNKRDDQRKRVYGF